MKNWWDEGRAVKIHKKQEEPFQPTVRTIEELEALYDIRAVAEHFKVTVATIYKWKCIGLITAEIKGRNLRFTARQIQECRIKLQNGWRRQKRKSQLEKLSG